MSTPLTAVMTILCCLNLSATIAAADPVTTVPPVKLSDNPVPPGTAMKIRFTWIAEGPLSQDNAVFVHVRDTNFNMVTQFDHGPAVVTGSPGWTGEVSYDHKVQVPADLKDGTYDLIIGLYHGVEGLERWKRMPVKAGPGVEDKGDRSFLVGTLTVDRSAPLPPADTERKPTLDIAGRAMTFSEEFDGTPAWRAWGPIGGDTGLRWTAHTPWSGDFGDARFMDPGEDDRFEVKDGKLIITAAKKPEWQDSDQWKREWRAGLLCSNDPQGNGFSQQYGYFVCRAKMPAGKGVWPAFWLSSSFDRKADGASGGNCVEIDVIEYYGQFPNGFQCAMHTWEPQPHKGEGYTVSTRPNECASGFHDYGVLVQPDYVTYYFDGIEVWRVLTPAAHQHPLSLLVNLALGSGWPIDETPNPSHMEIDYIRVYAPQADSVSSTESDSSS